eukprot:TRINITY_DN41875_c0_g1_i1.p1 TRINITY_DN41875_c0_g1~~TRINITY_DN41875_c0_g1_i1.p1  ORF type:complete len:171 (-),score=24.18 TRINITY_DN41875_c0_g1_i1:230-742(-)
MADDEPTFESATSGASTTYPVQCSALRKNGYVLLKGKPCKIMDMSTSKTGKHGHAKVHIVGIDIFDGKRYEDTSPSTHNMDVPNVSRIEYPITMMDDEFFILMKDDGEQKEDLSFNKNYCSPSTLEEVEAIVSECEKDSLNYQAVATVWSAMGQEIVKEVKKVPVKDRAV